MARAIGWYVHYTASGYQEKGINPSYGKAKFSNFKSQKERIKNRTKALLKSANLLPGDLELLQELLSPAAWNISSNNEAMTIVEEQASKALNEECRKYFIDINTGHALNSSSGYVGKHRSALVQLDQSIDKMTQSIDYIRKHLSAELKKNGSLNNVESKLKELREQWKQVVQNTKYNEQIAAARGANVHRVTGVGTQEIYGELKKLREQFNAIARKYHNLIQVENANTVGKFYEGFVSATPVLISTCKDAATEQLKKYASEITAALGGRNSTITIGNLEGSNTQSLYYDTGKFEQFKTSTTSPTGGKYELVMTPAQKGASQGKIDVVLNWREADLNLSVKSYDLKANPIVKVVEGSPLKFLIQDLNIDFVNHFLNIFSEHDEEKVVFDSRNEMKSEMTYILLYKALSGDNFRRKGASLFVLNDTSTGKARVYTIAQLLDLIDENSIQVRDESKTKIANWWFKNDFDEQSMYARIQKLLQQLHAKKISVSFNSAALK